MGRWLLFLPWYLAVSAFAAFALHRLVERPVLNWRDRYLESSESFALISERSERSEHFERLNSS